MSGQTLRELLEVLFERLVAVRADEAVHARQAEQLAGVDHFSEVTAGNLGLVGIVREGVGVVAKRGDLDAMLFAQAANVVGLRLA